MLLNTQVIMNESLLLLTQLSSVMVFLMGCLLLGLRIPPDPKLRNYRIARRTIACAYIVLGLSDLYRLFVENSTEYFEIGSFIVLIIAYFQAFLFTYAMITLFDYRIATRSKMLMHTFFISLVSALVLIAKFLFSDHIYNDVLYSACGLYVLYLVYCLLLFRKEYKKHVSRMDNYYSEDERKRLIWINNVFYMALTIGILAVLSIFGTPLFYTLFAVLYAVFYVYVGVRYVNYVNTFHYISNVVAVEDVAEEVSASSDDNNLEAKIVQWVQERKYTQGYITLDNLAADLNTNRTYLSRHINATMGCNFKTWISNLRIEDAKRLLLEDRDLSAVSVGELVGISDKSSFFRQFMNVVGVTPRDYREKHIAVK